MALQQGDDNTLNSVAEEQAFQLTRCAVALDQAAQKRDSEPAALTSALNDNLETWVMLRTLAGRDDSGLSPEVAENLTRLSNFVAGRVFASSEGISQETINTLININLQISEGLLEGQSGTAEAAQ